MGRIENGLSSLLISGFSVQVRGGAQKIIPVFEASLLPRGFPSPVSSAPPPAGFVGSAFAPAPPTFGFFGGSARLAAASDAQMAAFGSGVHLEAGAVKTRG
ncbi:hypothetical protein GCM10025780_36350 [Frondihabitans cladoniiphilus]|uniref:Uncharacterized protein n=1 Tax=Frondihabitans cladoniiphilus TaxID=715785 RepID=A0ABP8WDL8_9MICO